MINNVMYIFGGVAENADSLDDLYALDILSTARFILF